MGKNLCCFGGRKEKKQTRVGWVFFFFFWLILWESKEYGDTILWLRVGCLKYYQQQITKKKIHKQNLSIRLQHQKDEIQRQV